MGDDILVPRWRAVVSHSLCQLAALFNISLCFVGPSASNFGAACSSLPPLMGPAILSRVYREAVPCTSVSSFSWL